LDVHEHAEAVIAPGTMVDSFKVARLIGRGGMGEVYLARDMKLGRKVALKVVHPEALGDARNAERFSFEARVTARFSHPHIVTIFAVGEHNGSPYVALEYLEGQTLRERMEELRPSVKETLRIGLAIAEALSEAHRHKVLHRDLKPENGARCGHGPDRAARPDDQDGVRNP
jgi:serine/threonine protein kinase